MPRLAPPGAATGTQAISPAKENRPPERLQAKAHTRSPSSIRKESQPQRRARPAFRNWPEIRNELKAARRWAFFLDFDGTLAKLRRRPRDVRMSGMARSVLKRLAAHPNVVVTVVTGRRLRNVRKLVALNELRYVGVHGGERDEGQVALSAGSRAALEEAKRSVQRLLRRASGLWIEDKGVSVAVHYRNARARAVECVAETVSEIVAVRKDGLHVLHGSKVWEILPREIPGKVSALEKVLNDDRPDTAVIYMGNDGTDEVAFAALPNRITVQVGDEWSTSARFFVRSPAEALRLLARMEKELP